MSRTSSGEPTLSFRTAKAWEKWLEKNHATASGVWVKFPKKGTGEASAARSEALDAALCHGWIDGQARGFDERWFLQRFCPRKPRSIWSRINRRKALELIEQERMKPAGHAAIERAKANGRWDSAYEPPSTAQTPPDLAAALRKHPRAAAFFETLKGANRYAILFRLQTAGKPETRARRLARFVDMLDRGETLHG